MSDTSTDDRYYIESVLAGRSHDYAELVRRHQDRVFSLCLSLLRNPTDAEDAAQEVFLKAYRALSDFRFDSSFSTWLYRIAYRHSLDFLKAKNRRPAESWDALVEERGEPSPDTPPTEGADLARAVLDALPEDQRLILTFREAQGLTYEEIAETLQVSLDAVKARLRRAREALRQAARHFLPAAGVQSDGGAQ
jgi:RNA polymerase sigma-70 factor (ECF subfamily)